MRTKKLLSMMLALVMVLSCLPAVALADDDPLRLPDAPTATLTVKVDGVSMTVTAWEGIPYVANPVKSGQFGPPTDDQQKINIYVPSNADANSAIILYLDNSGWISNAYATAPKLENNQELSSAVDSRGAALKAGYVVVSYGCRSRGFDDENGNVIHSPATITDTKAAVRYLRYNDANIIGNTERIVVTGTSGGGALSAIICASGNSPDYYESLYEIGAAGMTSATTSTIKDDVFATIAYCPITDLPHADMAYEWTFGDTRKALKENGAYSADPNPENEGWPSDAEYGYGDLTMEASAELVAEFVTYFNSLGLKDGNTVLKADDGTLKAAITALLEKGVEKGIADNAAGSSSADPMGEYEWLTITDGKASIDWDKHMYWVAEQTVLKGAPSFDNQGTINQHWQFNENNLFGTPEQSYSHIVAWSWNNDTGEVDGVGAGAKTWAEFQASDEWKLVQQQGKMTNPIPYLRSASNGDSAPYWYVRYGMADRDSSFAVEATLYYSLMNDSSIKDVDFNFAWLKPHAGDYDVPEAYVWLAETLKAEAPAAPSTPAPAPSAPALDPLAPATQGDVCAMVISALGIDDGNAVAEIGAGLSPEAAITRIHTAVLISKALEQLNIRPELSDSEINELLSGFSDLAGISAEERGQLAVCVKLGIFVGNGNGTMTPNGSLLNKQMEILDAKLQGLK